MTMTMITGTVFNKYLEDATPGKITLYNGPFKALSSIYNNKCKAKNINGTIAGLKPGDKVGVCKRPVYIKGIHNKELSCIHFMIKSYQINVKDCDCMICCKRYSDTYPPEIPCACETIKSYNPEKNDPCTIM